MARRTSNIQVNILGDSKDLQRAFSQAQSASRSFGDKVKGDLGKLWGWAKTGATVLAGIGSTIAGLVLKGGLNRALGIEDAQAKLRGLGHDADSVAQIMDNALAAVKGTAFGLDEAATIAASAVASGIKPGQELERTLKLVADAATIAGAPLNEMGAIFNKIQANGRMMTEEMNQLQDRGLPILQWLQEEYGVTAEAMREMVTQGQVDAETFRKVIEDNISGAALESGETTRGAFANVGAALSRLGATIVEKFLPIAKDLFGGLIEGVDQLTSKVGPAMDAFAESPFFQKLQDHAQRIPEYMESAVEGITRFWESTEFLRDAIGNIVAGAVDIVKWAIDLNRNLGGIPAILGGIAGALRTLWTHPAFAAIGGIAWLIGEIGRSAREAKADAEALFGAWKRLGDEALTSYAQEAVITLATTEGMKDAMDDMGLTLLDLERAILGDEEALEKFATAQYQAGVAGSEEASGAIGYLREEILRHNNVVDIATELIELHKEAEAERARAAGVTTEAVEGADRALLTHIGITEDATDAIHGHAGATEEAGDDIEQALEDVARKAQEAFDRAYDEADDFMTGFEELPDRADVTLEQWITNMNARIAEFEAWHTNLAIIAEHGLVNLVAEFHEAGPEAAAGLAQEVVNHLKSGEYSMPWAAERAAAEARQVGTAIAEGAKAGIDGSVEKLAQSAAAMVNAAIARAKKAAHIESPSKVTEKEIGEPLAEGIAKGLEGSDAPGKAMDKMIGGLSRRAGPQSAHVAPMAAASSGGGQPVYITVNALDPQAAARAVVEALQTYNRNNGAIPIEIRSA